MADLRGKVSKALRHRILKILKNSWIKIVLNVDFFSFYLLGKFQYLGSGQKVSTRGEWRIF